MSLPVLDNPGMNYEELRDVGDQDTQGNHEALTWDTDDAPAVKVQRDGAMHECNHEDVPG